MPIDIGFEKTAQAILRGPKTLSEAPGSQVVDVEQEDALDRSDVGYFESIGQNIIDTGISTGAAKFLLSDPAPTAPDQNFDLEETLDRRTDLRTIIQPHMNDADNPLSQALFAELADVRSEEQLEFALNRVQAAEEDLRVAQANGLVPQIVGTIGGIGIDAAVVAAVLGLGSVAGAAGGAGAATAVNVGARSANIARLVAAGRIAGLGAIEGAGERAAQKLTNPTVLPQDIGEAAGFGAGFGALLGFAAPTLVGGVYRQLDAAPEILADEARSAGAAASPGRQETNVPAPGAGSGLPTGQLAQNVFRNPKRVLVDIGVQGKEGASEGLKGDRVFYDRMSRIFNVSTLHEAEVGGRLARETTVEDLTIHYRAKRVARQEASRTEWTTAIADVFGVHGLIGRAVNRLAPRQHKILNEDEYMAIADEMAAAVAEGKPVDPALVIPDDIASRMTPEQTDKLLKHLEKTARNDNDYYKEWGEQLMEVGLIEGDELIPGYRPQRWNPDTIEQSPVEFELFLTEVFKDSPDEAWVRRNFQELDDEGVGTGNNLMKDGEDWPTFAKRMPDEANEIRLEWQAELRRMAEDKAFAAREAVSRELANFTEKNADEIEERVDEALSKHLERRQKLLEELPKAKTPGQRLVLAEKLGRNQKKIDDVESKVYTIRKLRDEVDGAEAMIRRFGDNTTRRSGKKLSRKLKMAIRKEARAEARRAAEDEIRLIRRNLTDNKNAVGLPDDVLIEGSPRFKQRMINLGKHRHDPRARKFLKTSAKQARQSFELNVGPRLALKRLHGNDATFQKLIDDALSGYDEDGAKAAGKGLSKRRRRAKSLAEGMVRELTQSYVMTGASGRMQETFSSLLGSTVSSMVLGGQLLSQIPDTAVVAMAGGKLGTGFRDVLRRSKPILREAIEKGEGETAMILQGLESTEARRFNQLADIDDPNLEDAGGRLAWVARGMNNLAVAEGHFNLAHMWNSWIQRTFGTSFARQIDRDLARWGELPDDLKGFYAKLGYDENVAQQTAEMMNRHHVSLADGALRIPDSLKWSEEAPELLLKYKLAVQKAGMEAMPSPGVGDRPFLRHNPWGRLILQFTSFMFTAGERFIAPLIQKARLHPTAIQPYVAAFMGLTAGILTDYLKAGVRGEHDAWLDKADTEQGFRDIMWSGILRSPFMAGNSAAITENMLNLGGRRVNNLTEELVGVRPFQEAGTRFKERQGMYSLLGPTAGLALGTAPALAGKVMDGDWQSAWDMAQRRTPILNVFYLQLINKLME